MAAVRSKNTGPEIVVRKLIWSLGYRYRLHNKQLPGTPDLCFGSRKKVIFVNGCFWHFHAGCSKASIPKTRSHFWREKLLRNRERDKRNVTRLTDSGWSVLEVWECELKDLSTLSEKILSFLEEPVDDRDRQTVPSGPD